jgi:hypothetical protein
MMCGGYAGLTNILELQFQQEMIFERATADPRYHWELWMADDGSTWTMIASDGTTACIIEAGGSEKPGEAS